MTMFTGTQIKARNRPRCMFMTEDKVASQSSGERIELFNELLSQLNIQMGKLTLSYYHTSHFFKTSIPGRP